MNRVVRLLPWLAAALVAGWGYLWIVRGVHGAAVNSCLAGAFAVAGLWGALRALPERRVATDVGAAARAFEGESRPGAEASTEDLESLKSSAGGKP